MYLVKGVAWCLYNGIELTNICECRVLPYRENMKLMLQNPWGITSHVWRIRICRRIFGRSTQVLSI